MSFRPNLILQTDSYKQYHWTMRIHDTTRTYSYLSSRIGAKHAWNTAVGLQYTSRNIWKVPGSPGQTSTRPWTTCGRTSNTRS